MKLFRGINLCINTGNMCMHQKLETNTLTVWASQGVYLLSIRFKPYWQRNWGKNMK